MNGSCFILNINLIVENNEFPDASDEEKDCIHLLSETSCTAQLQIWSFMSHFEYWRKKPALK